MPELPEVETVCRGMRSSMMGKIISSVKIRRDGLRWPFPKQMGDRITGRTVFHITRRAKYILVNLDSDETIIIHLGMSGRILINDSNAVVFVIDQEVYGKHDHVTFYMNDGVTITFNDARRFGVMDLILTKDLHNHRLLKKIGPEPLGNSLNSDYLFQAFRNKSINIKMALLDQRLIGGLGNIYACEILYRSKISPNRKVSSLSKKSIDELVQTIRVVLLEAIDVGGSSLRDHRQTSGEIGYFQYNFAVYGRTNESCLNNACKTLIKRMVQGGRSTFYCPKCQR
jgi:formamidopyrimidine-DNA glycosylase